MDTNELEELSVDAAQAGAVRRAEKEYPPNDSGNAVRFIDAHPDQLRYVVSWNTWLTWNGNRWVIDDTKKVMRLAQLHNRDLIVQAAAEPDDYHRERMLKLALSLGNAPKLKSMLELAQFDLRVVVSPKLLDANGELIGVENGVIDLRTGQFRPGQKSDNITKCAGTAFDANARCPEWEKFLHTVLGGDADLIRYVWKAVGYTLSGSIREQCFFFLHGGGSNGKSTFMETIQALLGEYGQRASQNLFTATPNGREPTNEIARLFGARLVVGSETEDGSRLAESRIKDLTGGDTLTGRRLYQEAFDFKPVLKLWLFGNHKPVVRGTDEGMWRRVRLIPFEVQIPDEKKDRELPRKLIAELPGILNWAIEGYQLWLKERLAEPDCIKAAVAEYREEEDLLGDFLEDRTIAKPDGRVGRQELFDAYRSWCEHQNMKFSKHAKGFYKTLRERPTFSGVERKSNGVRYYEGIAFAGSPPAELSATTPAAFTSVEAQAA